MKREKDTNIDVAEVLASGVVLLKVNGPLLLVVVRE